MNNNVTTNVRIAVNPGIGSGTPGGRGGEPGGPGWPGGPGNNQGQFLMMVSQRPVIGGGIDNHGCPWKGGSLDPRAHDYHARPHPTPHTMRCLRRKKC